MGKEIKISLELQSALVEKYKNHEKLLDTDDDEYYKSRKQFLIGLSKAILICEEVFNKNGVDFKFDRSILK